MNNSCCDTPISTSFSTALTLLSEAVSVINDIEQCAVGDALNRIVAADIASSINVPQYDNSAMDGYAINVESFLTEKNRPLKVIGKSFAGAPFNGQINPGECVRIMTGANIPAGANCVIMQEYTQTQGTSVTIHVDTPKNGENVRLAGNDIAKGAIVVPKSKRLSPIDLGVLASVGVGTVPVFRKPRIGLFSTGDELTIPGEPLAEGAIYESNRYVLKGILEKLNCEILDLGIIQDSAEAIENAFFTATEKCDAVISSGGVSVGEADYTRDILLKLGDINFYKLAIKPGKPFAFGLLNNALFFGLPGNPVSATATMYQLVVPTLRKMSGEGFIQSQVFKAVAQNDIKKRPGKTDFQRGIYQATSSLHAPISVSAFNQQSSGALSEMARANCLLRLEEERGNISAGESVDIIPFDMWLI